jgi:hypothetical protein
MLDYPDTLCIFSFGQISRGIISIGQVNIGIFCLGQVSLSLLGAGQLSYSLMYTPIGQVVVAPYISFCQIGISWI